MKTTKKSLTRRLDKICSLIIRSRGICEKCGEQNYEKLHCAHIYSRTLKSVRWDFNNLVCLCWSCHAKVHQRPAEFGVWVKETYLGIEKYEALQEKARKPSKYTVSGMQELYKFLKERFGEAY